MEGGSEPQLLTPFPGDPDDPLDPDENSKWLQNIIKIEVFRYLVPKIDEKD